jgi:RNA polymerase sigma factor (sigma-70 family)
MNYAAQAGGEWKGAIDIEALWNEFHERVYRRLYRKVRNAQDAEDLTICAFVRAWQRQDRFAPTRYTNCTWLYLNARTVAYAFLRKRRQSTLSLDWIPEERGPSCAGPEELHDSAEARARVWRAVDRLPDMERRVMRARFHDGLTWQEVAREVGMGVRMAQYHAARAILLLREILAAE